MTKLQTVIVITSVINIVFFFCLRKKKIFKRGKDFLSIVGYIYNSSNSADVSYHCLAVFVLFCSVWPGRGILLMTCSFMSLVHFCCTLSTGIFHFIPFHKLSTLIHYTGNCSLIWEVRMKSTLWSCQSGNKYSVTEIFVRPFVLCFLRSFVRLFIHSFIH